MTENFQWTAEWASKLSKARNLAEKANEGDVFFLEMSRANPICSMYLVTGKVSNDDPNRRELHMHVDQEPRTYPYFPTTKESIRNLAYQEYTRKFQKKGKNTDSTEDVIMSKETFLRKFTEITVHADKSIRKTHGIMCYQDGNFENEDMSNVYILHISDVMNIHMRKKKGLKTTLVLPTHSLSYIPETTRNKFIEETLSEEMLAFLEDNIDFFYRLYCYYANDSFVPVRTKVDLRSPTFLYSRFFMNEPFFVKHQKGKLIEFNQFNTSFESKIAYRSA
jgi:hypothetical protein